MVSDLKQQKLPVFGVEDAEVAADQADELAHRALDLEAYSARSTGQRLSLRHGSRLVDVDRRTGRVWAANEAHLWNADAEPRLPDPPKARALATEYLNERKLLPSYAGKSPLSLVAAPDGGTFVAIYDAKQKKRTHRQLDVQVNMALQVDAGGGLKLPVVGGGGKVSLTLGDAGAVIGYHNSCRPAGGVVRESTVIPRAEADRHFKELTKDLNVKSFDASLAYQLTAGSNLLLPVWVYRGELSVRDRRVPMRLVTLPATESGPFPRPQRPQPPRPRRQTRGEAAALAARARRGLARSYNPYEAGTSWIGVSGGLSGSQNNAQGFVDGLADAGWKINFNWGDANAWESDWRRNDDTYVDAADFVFYTGHANQDGWVLRNPDDGFLSFTEVGSSPANPGDLWGQQDLEWMVIAACGPLQDDILAAGGGNVFNRWDGAFDGLHQLLGYGAITFDNEDEGAKLVEYARDGQPLIDAWFRTAKEVQPGTNGASAPDGPTVWVGAMYVYKSGQTSPRNDHLWGHGSVATDPHAPNVYVAMWSST